MWHTASDEETRAPPLRNSVASSFSINAFYLYNGHYYYYRDYYEFSTLRHTGSTVVVTMQPWTLGGCVPLSASFSNRTIFS